MKNGKDFIYEYSDLNLFQTRVKILAGKYTGLVLEFGGSLLRQINDQNTFSFEYILYEVPAKFEGQSLRGNKEFEEFAGNLLIDVVNARNKDPKEKKKLEAAASAIGKVGHNIEINAGWYIQPKQKLISKGLQGF